MDTLASSTPQPHLMEARSEFFAPKVMGVDHDSSSSPISSYSSPCPRREEKHTTFDIAAAVSDSTPKLETVEESKAQEESDEAISALVVCYQEAGKLPLTFKVECQNGCFIPIRNTRFLVMTKFLEEPFVIFDGFRRCFVEIPGTSAWEYPSSYYKYLLVKPRELAVTDCPGIGAKIQELTDYYESSIDAPFVRFPTPPRLEGIFFGPPTSFTDILKQGNPVQGTQTVNVEREVQTDSTTLKNNIAISTKDDALDEVEIVKATAGAKRKRVGKLKLKEVEARKRARTNGQTEQAGTEVGGSGGGQTIHATSEGCCCVRSGRDKAVPASVKGSGSVSDPIILSD